MKKSDTILLHLITVYMYLHVHELYFIENLKWLFGND